MWLSEEPTQSEVDKKYAKILLIRGCLSLWYVSYEVWLDLSSDLSQLLSDNNFLMFSQLLSGTCWDVVTISLFYNDY